MISESFELIKNHCQNILDVICKIENANHGQIVDQSTVLQELSSCITSFNKLGESLHHVIDEQNMIESNEHQTEEQLLVTNEVESQDLFLSDIESNVDVDANGINELISGTFDATMTLENLLKLSQMPGSIHSAVNGENYVNEINDNDQSDQENSMCTNNDNEGQEIQDIPLMIQDTSDINDTNIVDLQLGTNAMASKLEIMDDSLNIQAEETVMTADDKSESGEEVEPKRKRKLKTISDVDLQLEEILSKQIRQTVENVPLAVTLTDASNHEWLTEQDQSSMSSTQSGIENGEYLEDDTDLVDLRNTNSEIHCKNQIYCLLCDRNDPILPNHYIENHPDQEVFSARPSPKMAKRLRLQIDKFDTSKEDRTKGLCYFCEEKKTMSKSGWETHILTHTGELNFEHKSNHDDDERNSEPVNIFQANSTGSLVGFMCNDCNYLQIQPKRMIEHLANEHGYECPAENYHYEKLTLVSIAEQDNAQPCSTIQKPCQETTTANPPNRKSITFILPKIHRNTDRNVHYKNQSACMLCDDTIGPEQCLANHYTSCHPEDEVFSARPPPQGAHKLRSQIEQFTVNEKGKVVGTCYFCNDIKTMNKAQWRQHILKHTGEKVYFCTHCDIEVNYKKQHDTLRNLNKCDGKLISICEVNSSDGSYVGFMCNDCNYLQIKLERMIKHLTNEHDYNTPIENRHYHKYTLLPSIRVAKS